VHYAQAYVLSAGSSTPSHPKECFSGQVNGLCGAALPERLFLITGLHTGHVGFSVDVVDTPPPLDDSWEDVVETPFAGTVPDMALVEWAGTAVHPIPLPLGRLRVRYCARGMQRGRRVDTLLPGAAPVDTYSLTFWPTESTGDTVVRETTEVAAYWHRWARGLRK
jgi:hypothetical protein